MLEQERYEPVAFAFTTDDIQLVPRRGVLASRKEAYDSMDSFIYSAPMDKVTGYDMAKAMLEAGQIPVLSRFIPADEYWKTINEFKNTSNFWIAAGLDNYLVVRSALDPWSPTGICIDIAHGHSDRGLQAIRDIAAYGIPVMSGSIATPQAAIDCIEAGATHLRIGVSPGSMCSTAIMTGFGLPLASSVFNIHRALTPLQRQSITLIADGGIRTPGDAAKLMALGADGVMLGSGLAWTTESAGWIQDSSLTKPRKTYRGQASADFQREVLDRTAPCPEGASTPYREWAGETVASVVEHYKAGLASAVSYAGCRTLAELPYAGIEFIFVTSNGRREATPHGLEKQ